MWMRLDGKSIVCLVLAMVLLLAGQAAAAVLVKDGQGRAQIVVAADALPQVKYAALELQLHVLKMSGAELPIVHETGDDLPVRVYIGESQYTRELGLDASDLKREAFRIISADDHLVILGGDFLNPHIPQGFTHIRAREGPLKDWQQHTGRKWDFPFNAIYDPRYFNKDLGFSLFDATGTLFGVYELLERLGVRWYMPYGEDGTIIPALKTIEIPKEGSRRSPQFERRFMRFSFPSSDKEGFVWSKRQRLGMAELAWMSHGTPEVTRFSEEEHPEFFAVIGGQQALRRRGALPRLAEPLQKEMVDYSRAFLDRYPQMRFVSVGPADALTSMDDRDVAAGWLEEHRGENGRMSEYVWHFVDGIARELLASHPDRIVMGLAYSYYRNPPQRIETMPPNVGITFCQSRAYITSDEQHQKLDQERNQWLSKLPSGEFYIWEYYLNHIAVKQTQGVPVIFGQRMQKDMQLLKGKSKGEYVECSYAPGQMAYPALNHLMYYLQARLYWDVDLDRDALIEEYCRLYFGPAASEMKAFYVFAEEVWTRPLSRTITLTGGFLRKADIKRFFEILDRAKASVPADSVYARRVQQFIDECQPMKEIHPRLKRLGPDFVAPLAGERITVDGQLNDAAWQSDASHVMRDVHTEEVKEPGAQVKLRWATDDSGLYISVRCEEPNMTSLNPQVREHDSVSIFDNDVVEVFLETQTRSTFHLAINPNAAMYDSCSDAQMQPTGRGWNLNGQVATRRGEDHWTMELFIPIASLGEGAKRPTREEPWGINVCRTRFEDNRPQNSAISPSHGRFSTIARFGDLYVE